MSLPSNAERITASVERLYGRDPRRFAKLVVWVRTAKKQSYRAVDVVEALEHLEELEARGVQPAPWWPYMTRMLQGIRQRRERREHESYKRGVPNSTRAVMAELLREWSKGEGGK